MSKENGKLLIIFIITVTTIALLFCAGYNEMLTENAATLERISNLRYEVSILKYADCHDQCELKNPCINELGGDAWAWNESQWNIFKTCEFYECDQKCTRAFGDREKEYYL
jgi:hypothetical protein